MVLALNVEAEALSGGTARGEEPLTGRTGEVCTAADGTVMTRSGHMATSCNHRPVGARERR